MTTRYSPPLHGETESKLSFQARLTGPCAPGQKPGAVATPGAPGGAVTQKMIDDLRKQFGK